MTPVSVPPDPYQSALREARHAKIELADALAENTRLRAALANSTGACIYCSLPKENWAACKSGFPGCARADDAMGCPELGARIELHEANARIARLEEALSNLVAMDTEHDRLKKIGDSECAYYAFVKWQTPKWDEARRVLGKVSP